VRMRLEEGIGVSGGQLVRFSELAPDPWLLPDSFRNDPKFYSNAEMRRLRERPEEMSGVEQRRVRLAQRLAERESMGEVRESLRNAGRVRLMDQSGQAVIVHGSDIRLTPERRWAILPRASGQPVEVDRYLPDGTLAHYAAKSAEFASVASEGEGLTELSIRLVMTEVSAPGAPTALGPGVGVSGDRAQLAIAPLYAAGRPLDALIGRTSAELLALASPYVDRSRPDEFVLETTEDLARELRELEREILSKLQERWAMSAACLVMAVAGAVTAMRLGGALPLTVYLWSFFPALAGVITIMAGQQMTHDHGAIGLIVLWGGVGVLVVYTLVSYLHVARH
jgi:hypothetical protein